MAAENEMKKGNERNAMITQIHRKRKFIYQYSHSPLSLK